MMQLQETFVALGSNLGSDGRDRAQTVAAAIGAMRSAGLTVSRVSRFFATPCFPAGSGPDYVNACIALRAAPAPADLLPMLHAIEADFGRARLQRWGSRSLDLDLLAQGDTVLPDRAEFRRWSDLPAEQQVQTTPDRLILPHPRLADRAFVLVPLADIAPDWTHPVLQRSVRAMLADLPEAQRAEPVPI